MFFARHWKNLSFEEKKNKQLRKKVNRTLGKNIKEQMEAESQAPRGNDDKS